MTIRRSLVTLAILLTAGTAAAHSERQIASPIRPGPVPSLARVNPNTIVVCKATSKPTRAQLDDIRQRLRTATGDALAQAQADLAAWRRNRGLFPRCRYEHIQAAVNSTTDNTDILIMPGIYREEPSRAAPTSSTGDNLDGTYSYQWHLDHPNDQSLIAILGKHNITLEGTGSKPTDVLIDNAFAKDVGVRADHADGFIVRNLWQRDANEHGIYFVDGDGYVFDHAVGSYSNEYELFSFASDNGLYQDCEAVGGGDSGLYIGGDPDTHLIGRYSAELRTTKMHHNALGFSGTQGSSVWMHDNEFYDNAVGISYDSENDHPNFPQRWSVIENNDIHDNNFDIYAGTSDVPVRGPGYDFFRYPVGTGILDTGGEDNVIQNNRVYNNIRFGAILLSNPFEAPLPADVNRNSYLNNLMGTAAGNGAGANCTAFPPGTPGYTRGGSDYFWDETGDDNCWTLVGNEKTDPLTVPGACPAPNSGPGTPIGKTAMLLRCVLVQVPGSDPPQYQTSGPCVWGTTNYGPYVNRDEAECGNSYIDPLDASTLDGGGEDCDTGLWGGSPVIPDTCETLGHGPGTLGCDSFCAYDTSACAAPTCSAFYGGRAHVRHLASPPGDDQLNFTAHNLTGATFDPLTEDVSVAVRDEGGLVHVATIPGGSPGWSSTASAFTYSDPAGTFGGLTRVQLRTTSTFVYGPFSVSVVMHGADLSGSAGASTLTEVLRVGNDCWSQSAPCGPRSFHGFSCKGLPSP